jgi:hypothetical protein
MKTEIIINLQASKDIVVEQFNDAISYCKDNNIIKENNISDGYHTFNELYEFRKMYNAVLFNEWGNPNTTVRFLDNKQFDGVGSSTGVRYNVHKSWKHNDGELCFGGGWFIVSAMLPTGLISNHYKAEDWDLFKVPEVEKALYKFDGHTGNDVLNRLKALI